MTNSGTEDDDWEEGFRDEEQRSAGDDDVFDQLFHDRTSFQVKSFTLCHGHPSIHILVISWSDG